MVVFLVCIFPDESGIDTAMTRRYARARRSARANDAVPGGHWPRLTLLGTPGAEGLLAMMSVACATDTEITWAVLEQVLLPGLKERPHPIVVLDRLASLRSQWARAAFEAAGVEVRFLSAYSPSFTLIEPRGSKIKTTQRSTVARTVEVLEDVRPDVLGTVTASNAHGWLRHCRYEAT